MKKISKLIISIVICLLAGVIGSLFNTSIKTWYAALNKPFFTPPNWLFAPAWATLFVLMGISLHLVWANKRKTKTAFYLFAAQLILNIAWSFFFFYLQNPFFAFIELIILWLAILFTITEFHKISKTSAYLLIPYICWVTFAAVLNFSIIILN
jgi:tryptophan-rich sensory protein